VYKEPAAKKKAAVVAATMAVASEKKLKAEKPALVAREPSEMALKAATGPQGGAGLYDDDPLASAEGRKAHKRVSGKGSAARAMRPRSAATGEVLVDTARSMRGSTVGARTSSPQYLYFVDLTNIILLYLCHSQRHMAFIHSQAHMGSFARSHLFLPFLLTITFLRMLSASTNWVCR
jgi:hypothetical protein